MKFALQGRQAISFFYDLGHEQNQRVVGGIVFLADESRFDCSNENRPEQFSTINFYITYS